ncbi:MAG TPA: hypothetical protein VK447_10950, partial [Myxococcaceae bacterium]|nr:hypothetical protein [Myxococcaceae bacterium]
MNGKLKLLIPPALALLFMGGALMAAQFGAADGMAPEVSDASPAPSPVRPPPPARPPPQVRAPENAPAPQSPWKPSVAPAPQARPMNPLAAAAMGAQHPVPPPPGAEIRQPPPPPSNIQPMSAPEHPRGSAVPPPGYSDE